MKKSIGILAGGVAVMAFLAMQATAQDGAAGTTPPPPAGGGAGDAARAAMRDAMSFEKMDANTDGKVTLEEYQAAMAKVTEARFKGVDTNGDGTLSAEEVQKAREGFGRGGPRGGAGEGERRGRGEGEGRRGGQEGGAQK